MKNLLYRGLGCLLVSLGLVGCGDQNTTTPTSATTAVTSCLKQAFPGQVQDVRAQKPRPTYLQSSQPDLSQTSQILSIKLDRSGQAKSDVYVFRTPALAKAWQTSTEQQNLAEQQTQSVQGLEGTQGAPPPGTPVAGPTTTQVRGSVLITFYGSNQSQAAQQQVLSCIK